MSLYSQESFPKTIQIEGDTVIAITPNQLHWVNSVIRDKENLEFKEKEFNLLLTKQEVNLKKMSRLNGRLLEKNTKMLANYSDLIKLNETNDKLITYYKKEVDIQRRRKVWGTIGGFTFGVTVGATLFLFLK